jgi:hypothetical protein
MLTWSGMALFGVTQTATSRSCCFFFLVYYHAFFPSGYFGVVASTIA